MQYCGVKGNNTYQIVYTGNSDVAMDGAATLAEDAPAATVTPPVAASPLATALHCQTQPNCP